MHSPKSPFVAVKYLMSVISSPALEAIGPLSSRRFQPHFG